ncbi:MAG: YrzE family protein [Breznakibacter sp.]
MDLTEHIITYYSTESKHGFAGGLVSGIVLLISAILFWWFSNPPSILKGLAVIIFVGGLIFSIGGYYAGRTAKNALSEKIQLYQTDKQDFFEKEVAKVERDPQIMDRN